MTEVALLESGPPADGPKLPPMLQQYLAFKEERPDCLLFFQVGDFYELFFDDAVTASRVLNLTLTSRDKQSPNPVPMCGVPVAVVEGYLGRLVERGYSVAIVSQGAPDKGVVPRSLERVITPGVRLLAESDSAEGGATLACVSIVSEGEAAIASTIVEQGRVFVRDGLRREDLVRELSRLTPSEIVLPAHDGQGPVDRRRGWVMELERSLPGVAIKFRGEAIQSASDAIASIAGYAALNATSRRAVRLLHSYIRETTVRGEVGLCEIVIENDEGSLAIDATSRANLELVRNLRDGSSRGTLLEYLDATRTRPGKRLLYRWLLAPLAQRAPIEERLAIVGFLKEQGQLRERMGKLLDAVPDLERIAARLELGVAAPAELGALREGLSAAGEIAQILDQCTNNSDFPAPLGCLRELITVPVECMQILTRALVESPPLSVREGGIFREGYSTELDALRSARKEGLHWLTELESQERQRSGIGSLKVRYNGVLGYFFEITKANLSKVPADFVRRQSTAQADRFTNEALSALEEKVLGAEDRQLRLESSLFTELRGQVQPFAGELRRLCEVLAQLDCLRSFAQRADEESLVCPEIVDATELEIRQGRHPVLARTLRLAFVPNSLSMSAEGVRFWVLTGPNMGGKSTFLRQTALIVLLAQIGCYVPAEAARIGVVDRIFARLGASDNIAEGESTFMVEMREAAQILSLASPHSLLLIDEIGRGTATSDGLAIAQAIVEWITLKIGSRTLFATHFYELTALEALLPGVGNLSVGSVETKDGVLFTHEIHRGAADRSYGIEVARLAGVPAAILERARSLQRGPAVHLQREVQLDIFKDTPVETPHPVLEQLRSIDVMRTSPLEGLALLEKLQRQLLDE